jgi:hypothetical protein
MTSHTTQLPTRSPDAEIPAERTRQTDPALLSVILIRLREYDGETSPSLREDLIRLSQVVRDWDLENRSVAPDQGIVLRAHEVFHQQIGSLANGLVGLMAAATTCPGDDFHVANYTLGETFRRLDALAGVKTAAATQKLARLVPALYRAKDLVTGEAR